MLTKVVSFGFKHDFPPLPISGHLIIDVRKTFRNPYHDRKLRYMRGTDPEVQADIRKTPNFEALYTYIKEQVSAPGVKVAYIGCTGGHHRSVYLAELLSKEFGVPVEHRDLEKP